MFSNLKKAGLYTSCTVYYEPGNQGGIITGIFTYKDVFIDCESVVVQLYAESGLPNNLSVFPPSASPSA